MYLKSGEFIQTNLSYTIPMLWGSQKMETMDHDCSHWFENLSLRREYSLFVITSLLLRYETWH